jgi:DNA mismatch repair protein MutS2
VLAISDDSRELTVRCGVLRSTVAIETIEGLQGEQPQPPEARVQVQLRGRGPQVRSERNTVDVRGGRCG